MKKFAGFTPQQQYTLLSKQGYTGPADEASMAKFLAASPSAASKMGEYAQIAQQRLAGQPMPTQSMAVGGVVSPTPVTADEVPPEQEEPKPIASNVSELAQKSVISPTAIVTEPEVAKIEATPETLIDPTVGQAVKTPDALITTVQETAQAQAPEATPTATVAPTTVAEPIKQELDQVKAATAQVSAAGTVRGQLESLMQDFEKDGTPPWASGAMRQAMGAMAARGLGASSLAGQAIVQAAMESAIGIASQDAATTAQFEMQNLNNEQQTTVFKTQTRINSMLSDQAVENAAKQFNAASENQTNQFFSELKTTVSRFNTEQVNAIRQFNAGETNAAAKFNTQLENLRTQFNAQNSLVIAQANAQWRQNLTTLNTAAQNEANMSSAKIANGFTQTTIDQIWQRERDIMSAALTTAEGDADRNVSLMLGDKEAQALANRQATAQEAEDTASKWRLAANLIFG
jgi:hypothetical protein